MLSFWQHCYTTNSLDGLFRPSFFAQMCEVLHIQSVKWSLFFNVIGYINWKGMLELKPAAQTCHDKHVCVTRVIKICLTASMSVFWFFHNEAKDSVLLTLCEVG